MAIYNQIKSSSSYDVYTQASADVDKLDSTRLSLYATVIVEHANERLARHSLNRQTTTRNTSRSQQQQLSITTVMVRLVCPAALVKNLQQNIASGSTCISGSPSRSETANFIHSLSHSRGFLHGKRKAARACKRHSDRNEELMLNLLIHLRYRHEDAGRPTFTVI